ncbi:MAG TPA: glycosyltransferase, partial [Segetibacter sp.]
QEAVVEELQPAAILGDTMPTLKMVAEKTGVKYISLMNGYISRHRADVHQMPASHPLYKYCKNLPSGILNFFIEKGEQLSFKEIHRPFRELRSKYQLSKKYSYEDELEGDVNLLCDLPELFPQKILPKGYYHVPPLFYENHVLKDNVAEKTGKNKKTIFVSMGSTGDWNKARFLNHPYFQNYNIVTAGDNSRVVKGANVISRSFINIHELFPYTDLVICHGGNGTIYQALLYGIPLLCKTAHFEQQWNVHKLEQMQLGQSLDNIKKDEDAIAIVRQWLGKKKNMQLSFIESKIKEAIINFPATIDEIVQAEFYNQADSNVLNSLGQIKKIA